MYINETPCCGVGFLSGVHDNSTVAQIETAIVRYAKGHYGMVLAASTSAEKRTRNILKDAGFTKTAKRTKNPNTQRIVTLWSKAL